MKFFFSHNFFLVKMNFETQQPQISSRLYPVIYQKRVEENVLGKRVP